MRRKSPTSVEELADYLDLGPEHVPLLRLALVHRSQGEAPGTTNERLEFLGDSVLGMLTNEYLYEKHPDASEGDLTRMKANVVNKTSLARAARPLGLGLLLDMARSEEALGGRDRSSTLADAFEAVLGAIYLNAGLGAARRFLHEHLFPEVDLTRAWDYKSTLQELFQERFRSAPEYRIISESGPAHAREFVAEVYLKDELLGTGRGGSKKQAEQVAAAEALMVLATRLKKPRRSRKKPAPAVPEVAMLPTTDGVLPVSEKAPALPLAQPGPEPAETILETAPAAGAVTKPRPSRKSVPPPEEAVQAVAGDSPAAPAIEATVPSAPARSAGRTRKSGRDALPTSGQDAEPREPAAAGEAAPRRSRRRRAEAVVDGGGAPVTPGEPAAAPAAAEIPVAEEGAARPRARKRRVAEAAETAPTAEVAAERAGSAAGGRAKEAASEFSPRSQRRRAPGKGAQS